MTITADELRAYCLDLPATVEDYPFGRRPDLCTFTVAGKFSAQRVGRREPARVR